MKSDQKGQMVQTEKEPMGSKVLQEGSKLRKLLIQKQEIFLYPKGNCQAPRERTQLRTMDCFIVREQSWGLIRKYSLLVVKLGGLKTWPKCIAFYSFFYPPPPFLTSPFLSFFSIPFLFLPLLPSILLSSLPFIKYLSTRNFGIAMNSWLWFILSFLNRNVYFCCFVPVSPLCWLCNIKLVFLSSKYF